MHHAPTATRRYSNAGQGACTNCDAGKYNNQLAQTSSDACGDCGAGKYTFNADTEMHRLLRESSGQTFKWCCTNCDAGRYSDAGQTRMSYVPIRMVFFCPAYQSTCLPCPTPKYCFVNSTCIHGRGGIACSNCIPNFHAPLWG